MISSLCRVLPRVALAITMVGACTGCGSSRPTKYFVLDAGDTRLAEVASPGEASPGIVVGLLDVDVADYLTRSKIVTRNSNTQMTVSEFHAWAERLDLAITRAIVVGLHRHPRVGGVVKLPSLVDVQPDRIAMIEILWFDGVLGGEVGLTARYTILDADRRPLAGPVWFVRSLKATDPSYTSLVDCMSELLAGLADEVATALTR